MTTYGQGVATESQTRARGRGSDNAPPARRDRPKPSRRKLDGPHTTPKTPSLFHPAVHTAMAKLGTVLASSGDIFMLTICLLLIEIRRWLDE